MGLYTSVVDNLVWQLKPLLLYFLTRNRAVSHWGTTIALIAARGSANKHTDRHYTALDSDVCC